jgi:hypothetical protein
MTLTPDRADLNDYLDMVFGYADPGEENFAYAIVLRGLGEKGTDGEGVFNEVQVMPPLTGALAVDMIYGHVQRYSLHHRASFIVPALVSPRALSDGKATEDRILSLTTVVVDLDKGDTAGKLAHAAKHLGTPSMVVESGGTTETGHAKLHVYWRLSEPCTDVALVAAVRKELALKLGGDPAFGRCTQVIRLPGSIYSKNNVERPCRITERSHYEFEIDTLKDAVTEMGCADGIQLDASLLPVLVASYAGGGLNFSAFKAARGDLQGERADVVPVLTQDVREGGDSERNRWSSFNVAAGLHLYEARSGKIGLDQAKEVTAAWMATHMVPPWPEAKFNTEWNALVAKDLREKGPFAPLRVVAQNSAAPAPLLDKGVRDLSGKWSQQQPLVDFNVRKLAKLEIPDRKFLVDGLVMAGKSHLMAAEGGVGKTMLLLDLAIKIAGHSPDKLQSWCGMPLEDDAGGKVVMFTTEDDADELTIRLHDLMTKEQWEAAGDRFSLIPTMSIGGAFPLVERERPGGPPLLGQQWRTWLDQLEGLGKDLKLVVIDTLNTSLHGEENSATIINEYVQAASAYVCGKFGAALVVTHHLRKPGNNVRIYTADDMKNSIRGSTALTGAFRVVLGIWHAPDWKARLERLGEEAKPSRLFNFAVVKANNPEMHFGLRTMLRQKTGLLMDISDREQAIVSAEAGSAAAWMIKAVAYAAEKFHPFTITTISRKAPAGRRHQLPAVLRAMGREDLETLCGELCGDEGGRRLVKCKIKGQRLYSLLDVPGGPLASNVGDDGGAYVIREGADFKAPDWEKDFIPHATEDRIVVRGKQFERTPWAGRDMEDEPHPPLNPNRED